MDSLPNEILGPEILGAHLSVRELVRCKQVSKRFYWVIRNLVRVEELVLSDIVDEFKGTWYHSNKPIEYEHAVETTFLNYDRLNLRRNLKRLHLSPFCNPKLSEFLDLKAFERLEQLDIATRIGCRVGVISSASLKMFSCGAHCKLLFRTPKLQVLKCQDLNLVSLSDPQQLKHLEVANYSEKIESLTGLECLQINYVDENRLSKDILLALTNLKRLSLNPARALERPQEAFREYRSVLAHLIKQKLVLRRTELRIFLFAVELVNNAMIDEYDPISGELYFQIANYPLLCGNLSSHQSVDYNDLKYLFDNQIKSDYFTKFANIRRVVLLGEADDRFVSFLSKLNQFQSLCLKSALFVQSSLDRLPDLCGKLTELQIKQNVDSPINCKFIWRFRLLRRFSTNQYSPDLIDVALQSTQRLEYLESFAYHKSSRLKLAVTVCKKEKHRFDFLSADRTGPANLSLKIQPKITFDDLSKLCNDLKASITDTFFFFFIATGN